MRVTSTWRNCWGGGRKECISLALGWTGRTGRTGSAAIFHTIQLGLFRQRPGQRGSTGGVRWFGLQRLWIIVQLRPIKDYCQWLSVSQSKALGFLIELICISSSPETLWCPMTVTTIIKQVTDECLKWCTKNTLFYRSHVHWLSFS